MPREILTIGRWGDDWCLRVNQMKKHRKSDCLESTPVCWPGNLFADLCSTKLVCWETIAASSSGSKDGILRCNRMVLCLALVGDHWAEGLKVAEAPMGILFAPFGNNISSLHPTIPSPIDLATRCSLHCNRKGMAKL